MNHIFYKSIAVALTFALSPAQLQAQDAACAALAVERTRVSAEMAQLVLEYPGVHIVIGICGVLAKNEFDTSGSKENAAGVFMGCAALGCTIAGFSDCFKVSRQWVGLSLRQREIQRICPR